MAKSRAEPKYDLEAALYWGDKIALAIENPSFDKDCKLQFCVGGGSTKERSQNPGLKKCGRYGRIAADPRELGGMLREVVQAFRATSRKP